MEIEKAAEISQGEANMEQQVEGKQHLSFDIVLW